MRLHREGRWLVADLESPHRVTSWAIVGGGDREARTVAWCQVVNAELPVEVDATAFLRDRLREVGLTEAVGFLTGCDLDAFEDVTVGAARCVATVGLSNALRAGDPPGWPAPGTINLLCVVAEPLSTEARLEAIALAAEARTIAVLEAAYPSMRTGKVASGTGTDCIAIASPIGQPETPFVGKHTRAGHELGAAVLQATRRGIASWLEHRR